MNCIILQLWFLSIAGIQFIESAGPYRPPRQQSRFDPPAVRPPGRRPQSSIAFSSPTIFDHLLSLLNEPPKVVKHAPVLTRASSTSGVRPTHAQSSYTTPKIRATTTPEPPEADESFSYTSYSSYDFPSYSDVDYLGNLLSDDWFGSFDFGATGYGGGESVEEETSASSNQRRGRRKNQKQKQQQKTKIKKTPPPTTTTRTTTTTEPPTTPEAEEIEQQTIHVQQPKPTTPAPSGGLCFCSPMRSCPIGSIPRGGYCDNFMSYFTNTQYRRCCYRPSVAKKWF